MIKTGLDVFLEQNGGKWKGKRLGLILHQASVTRRLEPAVEALRRKSFKLKVLFAPEHGLAGTLQDQVSVNSARDRATGLPVHSLYGKHLSPSGAQLKGLDALVFDLQDIGVRYYTFIWTMALAMRSAAEAGIPFIVLDRPNPLGGEILEGNILDPRFSSFVGLYPVPVRHGMTCGELAGYFNKVFDLGVDLHVIRMRGWRRKSWFDETGLPWVMPSPNMPTLDTAAVYAGMCLLEATNLSEGRGTTRPFEIIGAPFVDPERWARELESQKLPGVRFRPCAFVPTFNKWAGSTCHGVQIHVTDRRIFRSFLTGLAVLRASLRFDRNFRWRNPPYEYETEKRPIDILCGSDRFRKDLEKNVPLRAIAVSWRGPLALFKAVRKPYLLY